MLNETQINKNIIKKNKIINPESIYDEKWNFKDKFNAKECRIIRKKILNEEFHKQDLIFDEYTVCKLFKKRTKRKANDEFSVRKYQNSRNKKYNE